MFRFLELSLHGWDLWQQVRVPMDRDVVLLVGPNGSGKTTFLDAIRQLLAARKLSSKRRLQNYLRRPDQPALIRAVVSNTAIDGGQQPFHRERVFDKEVTLACALVPNSSGSPDKRFAIVSGRPSIQDLQHRLLDGREYYAPEQYERALANAGLSRSLMAVLAIEQGRTHQLFESTPRELFHRVLDMLGEKAVLDRYAEARRRYQEAESEVSRQAGALTTKQTELQAVQRQVERRRHWEDQRDKVEELRQRVPAAKYQQMWGKKEDQETKIQELRTKVRKGEGDRLTFKEAVDVAGRAVDTAAPTAAEAEAAAQRATMVWGDAKGDDRTVRDELTRLETAIADAQKLLPVDLPALEHEYDGLLRRRFTAEQLVIETSNAVVTLEGELTVLRRGAFVYPNAVSKTMDELKDAGIEFSVLCSLVEDVREGVAEAVEAAIGDARFALLVREKDEEQACRIARTHAFPGPIYSGAGLDEDQQAGPVRLAAGAPTWLLAVLAETSFGNDGSFCDHRGRWVGGHDGRFLGKKALEVAIVSAEDRLAVTQAAAASARNSFDLAEQERATLEGRLTIERQRRDTLKRAAEVPSVRERAQAAADLLARATDDMNAAGKERERTSGILAGARAHLLESTRDQERFEKQLAGEKSALAAMETEVMRLVSELDPLRASLTPDLLRRAEAKELEGAETVERDLQRAEETFSSLGEPPPPEVVLEAAQLEANVAELEKHVKERTREAQAASKELATCRARYIEVVGHTLREYRNRAVELARGADIVLEMDLPELRNDDTVLDEACISPRFGFDAKTPLAMGDSSFSGGQQVVAGLILLMAMAETEGRGFFLLDEPFAHLSIDRVDQVGKFLSASRSQFIITAPTTLDRGQLNPASMVIVLQKKRRDAPFAPPPLVALA